jgi:hypothetical protein
MSILTPRGACISTPRGSEADALDYWFDQCDVLFWEASSSSKKKLCNEEYCRRATRLDDEGVGHYYRALCNWELFPKEPHPRLVLHPLMQGPVSAKSLFALNLNQNQKG